MVLASMGALLPMLRRLGMFQGAAYSILCPGRDGPTETRFTPPLSLYAVGGRRIRVKEV